MRYILTIIFLLGASSAYAGGCGSEFEFGPTVELNEDGEVEAQLEFKWTIVLDNSNCENEQADTMQERIRNLERIIKICEKNNIPELCDRIPELAAEISTM